MAPVSSETPPVPFKLPKITLNPNGWGPLPDAVEAFSDVPYLPFSKADRVGRIADFGMPEYMQRRDDRWVDRGDRDRVGEDGEARPDQRRPRGRGGEPFGAGLVSQFSYIHSVEEDHTFSVVMGATPTTRSRGGGRGGMGGGRGRGGPRGGGQGGRGGAQGGRGGQQSRWGNRRGWNDKPQRLRDASVKVGGDWSVRDEYDFPRLSKMVYDTSGKILPGDAQDSVEDYGNFGTAFFYDKQTFERVSAKNAKPVPETDKVFPGLRATASQDPVFQEMAKAATSRTVFATDTVLSTLMCATRSVFSWDVVVVKEGDKMWLDKRPGAAIDFVTVNENAPEPPAETPDAKENSAGSLAAEATAVNRNLLGLVLKESDKFELPDPNPFTEEADSSTGSLLLRYRTFHLPGFDLAVRAAVDGAVYVQNTASSGLAPAGIEPESSRFPVADTVLANFKALLEYDLRTTDWRKKLEAHRGVVLATEIKNNGNRLVRWAVEAAVAGVGQIRIGFVSRPAPRVAKNHVLLSLMSFKPREFAGQMNLSLNNAWGVLRTIIDRLWGYEDGKYVIVRDPNKPVIRIYEVPSSTFDDEFDEEEEGMDDM